MDEKGFGTTIQVVIPMLTIFIVLWQMKRDRVSRPIQWVVIAGSAIVIALAAVPPIWAWLTATFR